MMVIWQLIWQQSLDQLFLESQAAFDGCFISSDALGFAGD